MGFWKKIDAFFTDSTIAREHSPFRKIVLFLLFFVLITVLLSIDFLPDKVSLTLGQVSERDVVAPRTVSFVDEPHEGVVITCAGRYRALKARCPARDNQGTYPHGGLENAVGEEDRHACPVARLVHPAEYPVARRVGGEERNANSPPVPPRFSVCHLVFVNLCYILRSRKREHSSVVGTEAQYVAHLPVLLAVFYVHQQMVAGRSDDLYSLVERRQPLDAHVLAADREDAALPAAGRPRAVPRHRL